ncbi:MAG: divalent metal cation transporter [SAR92 clade bacterium]|uniref:Divalent metal cation transporter n=1 Tax=SAR92 clade bacterium TaxID=2315479 RepID=A0A520LNY4_9GAMM|nr:MAG: divalent metal cation transporter [SAR92 clade bacterium]|tara:strand:+ start:5461 stop:6654 length:1194 start_codon:yes stop_codon:yes gene_type:complete
MKRFGPGMLVAAAFIGPGTVTTASIAGANFGFVLIWALLLSCIITFVLQEMSSRLGIVSGLGLSESLNQSIQNSTTKLCLMGLVVAAIGAGNAAFEVGNITGAAIGLNQIIGLSVPECSVFIGIIAFILLGTNAFKLIEPLLTVLVILMSLLFLVTMMIIDIDLQEFMNGLMNPKISSESLIMIMALIGTTVVPYNLFLHAHFSKQKWKELEPSKALKYSRVDTAVAISLGGLITLAIMSTSAVAFFGSAVNISANNIGEQLNPILGSYSNYIFSFGLFAAGVTSAVTAPLAASIAVTEALGWENDPSQKKFKVIWISIISVGTLFAFLGTKPLEAILFAQATNALLLPIIAIFLFYIVNKTQVMGSYTNGFWVNFLAVIIIISILSLSGYKVSTLI